MPDLTGPESRDVFRRQILALGPLIDQLRIDRELLKVQIDLVSPTPTAVVDAFTAVSADVDAIAQFCHY